MKTFNAKFAIWAFAFVTLFDAVLFVLSHFLPVSLISVPWWSVNFASLPLISPFMDRLQPGTWSMAILVVGAWLLSGAFWSLAAGLLFRRRYAA